MSRKSILPQSPHHVLLFDEDWEWLNAHFGRYSGAKIGVSEAVRTLVHAFVMDKRNKEIQARDAARPASPEGEIE